MCQYFSNMVWIATYLAGLSKMVEALEYMHHILYFVVLIAIYVLITV